MRTATIEEVTEAITRHAAETPGGAIAFDGDGTLWSGDIGEDLFEALVASGRIERVAHEALAVEARAEWLDATGTASEIATRIHHAYLAGKFPEERVCEIMTWAFAGWTLPDLEAFADRTLDAVGLTLRLHSEAIAVVNWASSHGIDVFLVSASPRAVVLAAARRLGIDAARVTAATEQVVGGRVHAAVERPIPYGPGKVTRLRALLGARPLYAAFGDNAFDVSLLRDARVPIAIRPKPRLVERANEVPGLATLARDDG